MTGPEKNTYLYNFKEIQSKKEKQLVPPTSENSVWLQFSLCTFDTLDNKARHIVITSIETNKFLSIVSARVGNRLNALFHECKEDGDVILVEYQWALNTVKGKIST